MKRAAFAALAALMASLVAAPTLAAVDSASIVRGARLYDNWSLESKERLPVHPNPAFKTKQVRVAAADTWRCVECHGWDYKGKHGIVGIRARQNADPAAIIARLKDANHGYEELLHDSDRLDLANFVAYGQVDMQKLIEAERRAKVPYGGSEKIYSTVCSSCHGLDGGRLREVAPLGDSARKRPTEILHTVLNGHPGGNMPALRTLGEDVAARMLAFLQTLPTANLAASIVNGGRLYNDWQTHVGRQGQALPHPAYPPKGYYAEVASITWRCKECHGWDYKGNQGAYSSGTHATGIKGIRAMAGADPDRIVAILRNNTHRYGSVLKQRDLYDLANFVSVGQVDMDTMIDPRTRLARGDAARGMVHYRAICAGCHGLEGRFIAKRHLGRVAKDDPWHALHNLLNGHPDDTMPSLREIDGKTAVDILAHIQTLQDKR